MSEGIDNPLDRAAAVIFHDEDAVLRQILEANPEILNAADPDTELGEGFTLLHEAGYQGAKKCLRMLLTLGAEINALDASGSPPMYVALGEGHFGTALELLHEGAAADLANLGGKTPLMLAAYHSSHPECLRFAEEALRMGAVLDLNSAVRLGDIASVKSMIAKEPGAIERCPLPDALVVDAVRIGSPELVAVLIAAGAEVNGSKEDGNPLVKATYSRQANLEVVRLLLDAGADPNAVDAAGRSCLETAVARRQDDLAQLLRQHGAREGTGRKPGSSVRDEA